VIQFTQIDLRTDPESSQYIKNEIVQVQFAECDGELISKEGPNRYGVGDALITGSTGDSWSVSRDRFDAKYEPIAPVLQGNNGAYRNKPIPVHAKQVNQSFSIARSTGGDLLKGNAQDWLLQYAPGDYGIVENVRFEKVYRLFVGHPEKV